MLDGAVSKFSTWKNMTLRDWEFDAAGHKVRKYKWCKCGQNRAPVSH